MYPGMAVNYCNMTVYYWGILMLENNRFFTAVIYHGKLLHYFYNIGPRGWGSMFNLVNVDGTN